MGKIKIYQRHYSHTYEGGYTGDVNITESVTDTYVEVLNIKKCFKQDTYMHEAREWVNKTFAEEQYNQLQGVIKDQEQEIEKAKQTIKESKAKLLTFLVDVEISK